MSKKPTISIILTSYNHVEFLKEAIDSVLNQTFKDFELIIWDDNSSDRSWNLIKQYADPRIKSFHNDVQKGGRWGINKAISEIILGEYVAIHHSDDVWEPEKLEKQLLFLKKNPQIGAIFTNATSISENGEPLKDKSHFYYSIFDQPNRNRFEWLNFFFNHGNALCHPSVLIRKQCYDVCGLYRSGFSQLGDFDMWVRLCLKYEIYVLPEKLVKFRVLSNEMNSSGNRPEVRIRWHYEFMQILFNYCNISDSDELINIFPSARKYLKPEGIDIGYALGMSMLEFGVSNSAKLLGLDLLFEAMSDSNRKIKINQLYGFSDKDFSDLTAEHDVFSIEVVANLNAGMRKFTSQVNILESQVNTLNLHISTLKSQIDALKILELELENIYKSKSWKMVQFFQRIRLFLAPSGTRREKLIRFILRK